MELSGRVHPAAHWRCRKQHARPPLQAEKDHAAAKTTLNAKNLEALGAERLAELLLEISAGNASAKRRLRLALAGAQSPNEVAKEVCKRLTTIFRHAFIRIEPFEGIIGEALLVLHAVARHRFYPENLRDFRKIIPQYPAECPWSAGSVLSIDRLRIGDRAMCR